MKRFKFIFAVVFVFTICVIAYAQGPGWSGGGGYGMGPGMMGGYGGGYGMGPGMMVGYGGYYQSEECRKFFDETAGLRKELYNKRYDYFEAYRNPKTSPETITKLEREIRELQDKINEKQPRGYSCWW